MTAVEPLDRLGLALDELDAAIADNIARGTLIRQRIRAHQRKLADGASD